MNHFINAVAAMTIALSFSPSAMAQENIQEHARVAEMVATALEFGMRTLKQDGIEKVLMGITDMKQVRAVCIK